jgi:hypothetical protein
MKFTKKSMMNEVLVDVPRFELGNRNAERMRCFILGFQVNELCKSKFPFHAISSVMFVKIAAFSIEVQSNIDRVDRSSVEC